MSRFIVADLPIAGLKRITRQRMGDTRGFLERMFCSQELMAAGWQKSISQINHTFTEKKGTVRGLHFQQSPYSEMKLVSCLRGAVFDVVVDLRANSSTYLKWHAETLTAENGISLLVPEGLAHGFQTMTTNCEMLYSHSELYNPKAESGLRFDDPILNITWPLELTDCSERDRNHPFLTREFRGITA
jgi:dTDP-4-dehydrorhamnose 3,5-epimerase